MQQPPAHRRTGWRGFTLIEVMIVVAMIAILAAIAMPSYQKYVMKTRRTDAKNALLDMATRQEKFYSVNNRYSKTAGELGYSILPYPYASGGQSFYDISVDFSGKDTNTFLAKATPKGPQANDKECGTFTLKNTGEKGVESATLSYDRCW